MDSGLVVFAYMPHRCSMDYVFSRDKPVEMNRILLWEILLPTFLASKVSNTIERGHQSRSPGQMILNKVLMILNFNKKRFGMKFFVAVLYNALVF
ncbi:hypothetical protein FRX31_007657 [Thalictrum thalictroides]|uniref:Uncharacterized protein n=1 Tax=Thalictrum thalictroides TaxID=46969 RepID=A0A7J6WZ66_THATH|nr:hypothetical protein FRX31_007657 [Thalictrum thalictroides]